MASFTHMRGARLAAAALALIPGAGCIQSQRGGATESAQLHDYAGAYVWEESGFLYLQPWSELTASSQLVAFDENGDVRALTLAGRDRFTAGPAAGVASPVESRIEFRRDAAGRVISLTWEKEGSPARAARRADTERHEEVAFSNGDIRLAGTLFRPNTTARVPAVILVHGSGPLDREYMLPHARFLVRRGMAVLGYDKRGVGGSTGDWRSASFDALAGDVVAAYEYLRTRADIDAEHIGLLGVSQAGWVMPIAATRASGIAFLISVSGAGIPVAETTIDQARNEMTARGMKPENVEAIVRLMDVQYRFARTGEGWDDYAAARAAIEARLGRAPPSFPATRDDPHWRYIRLIYFHDPGPALRRLTVPTLAIFGELDNNIVAPKNRAAWETALRVSGNRDFALHVLPKANHIMLEAKVGSNAEMASLQRFVPAYSSLVVEWLSARVPGLAPR